MKSNRLFFLFLAMVLIWGVSFPINKVGLFHTSATNFIEWRLIIASAGLLILALITKNFALPRKIDVPIIVAVGVFQMGLTLILSTYGLSVTQAGEATFLIYTTPIWIILIMALLNKKVTFLDCLGFVCGLAGTVSLFNPLRFHFFDYSSWIGEFSLILAALAWSIGIIATHRLKWHRPPQKLLFWQTLTAALMAAIYGWIRGVGLIPQNPDLVLFGSLFYTGLLSIALGYWLMVVLSKNLPPAITSFGLLWVPIISLGISHFFLNEKLTTHLIVSVSLILLGILLHIYSEIKTHNRSRDVPP